MARICPCASGCTLQHEQASPGVPNTPNSRFATNSQQRVWVSKQLQSINADHDANLKKVSHPAILCSTPYSRRDIISPSSRTSRKRNSTRTRQELLRQLQPTLWSLRHPIIATRCVPCTGGTALPGCLIVARGLCIGLLGVGMAKSFILHSYLIPRRLLISLANLSSSASPESGREGVSHCFYEYC